MSPLRTGLWTSMAMVAFAGNSLLCRAALKGTAIDAASFNAIRLISGALVLWMITQVVRRDAAGSGNWVSALALFAYAAGFSVAYVDLPAATGALLLFVAVQATMISHGLWKGEHLSRLQTVGLVFALSGLVGLLLPGLASPPFVNALLMLSAGVAWGIYSLRGRGAGDPTKVTAGNFTRAALLAASFGLIVISRGSASWDVAGVSFAVTSGALASGLGYVIWYSVLPNLRAASAATVQLSVPVISAFGGVLVLGESISSRLVLASVAILGGIALVILGKRESQSIRAEQGRRH